MLIPFGQTACTFHIDTVGTIYHDLCYGVIIEELLQDVKENYYEKYSQINLDKKQITAKGFETIRQLITEEISFVKKEL